LFVAVKCGISEEKVAIFLVWGKSFLIENQDAFNSVSKTLSCEESKNLVVLPIDVEIQQQRHQTNKQTTFSWEK